MSTLLPFMRCVRATVLLVGLGCCQRMSTAPRATSTPDASSTRDETVVAPKLNLPTVGGKRLSLRSLRGSYVVVVFWASDNEASRAESSNLRKIYRQFHSRGLEIYGVSLDRDRQQWQQAIRTDGLTWPQAIDERGWKSRNILAYGATALPYCVLVDPDGRILARNLLGRPLGQKIAEYIPLD